MSASRAPTFTPATAHPARAFPRVRLHSAATELLALRIPLPHRQPSPSLKPVAPLSMPLSPPMPYSASSSRSVPALAATAFPSSGTELAKVVAMANSGKSPQSLSLETARSRAVNGVLPKYGAVTVSTPGALDGWWTMHQRYGRLKWAELFAPAIHYCENGTPVPQIIGWYIKRNLAAFTAPKSGVEETVNALHTWAPGGRAPNENEVFRNPDLARTYKLIAAGGRDAYYDGPIAKTIDAYFKRIGGWLSAADLRAHHAEWLEPLVTTYRGIEVYAMPANTQGLATLQMLNILENFDMREMGFQSAVSIHTADGSQAARLRRPCALLRRSALREDPHRLVELQRLREAARRAHSLRPHPHASTSRPGAKPRRHHLLLRRGLRRHDGLADPVELPRHGLGPRRRWPGLHVPGPRRAVLAAGRAPEHLRARQAPLPDHHPRLRVQGRQAVAVLRRDGRRHAAARPDADHPQSCRLRARRAGGGRQSALAP